MRSAEVTAVDTRLLKCALEIEDARAYWTHAPVAPGATAQHAFDDGTGSGLAAWRASRC